MCFYCGWISQCKPSYEVYVGKSFTIFCVYPSTCEKGMVYIDYDDSNNLEYLKCHLLNLRSHPICEWNVTYCFWCFKLMEEEWEAIWQQHFQVTAWYIKLSGGVWGLPFTKKRYKYSRLHLSYVSGSMMSYHITISFYC